MKKVIDPNPSDKQFNRKKKDEVWEMVVKMTLIFRDLMVGNPALKAIGYEEESLGHNAIVSGFQGQRQWTDHFPNGDFPEAILNSSFDWNGIREPFIVATENDTLNGVCMLLGHLLTGTAQVFGDIRTFWSPEAVERVTGKKLTGKAQNGFIHFINSGSAALDGSGYQSHDGKPVMKKYWDINPEDVEACLKATKWCPANHEYFRGGGYSSNFLTKGDIPVTMSRINLVKGVGPVLQIAEGFTVDLPDDVHNILDQRTDPTWPTTWFVPRLTGQDAFASVYSVMNSWGSNHGVLTYGHVGDEWITLASILRIPVAMHNVPGERIFRPGVWDSYGSMESDGGRFQGLQKLWACFWENQVLKINKANYNSTDVACYVRTCSSKNHILSSRPPLLREVMFFQKRVPLKRFVYLPIKPASTWENRPSLI